MHREKAEIAEFLDRHGVEANLATPIFAKFGAGAVKLIESNPYRLLAVLSWPKVDCIGLSIGLKNHGCRLVGAVEQCMYVGELFTGVEVVKHLYLEGGVRRLAVDVSAQVLDYPEVSRKPGVWDPQVGMTYRVPMGEHLLLTMHGDYGGFGVGSEVDLNTSLTLDWRMARHFGLTLGYGALYFRLQDSWVDSTRIEKSLELGTTLHDPILGFKLLF